MESFEQFMQRREQAARSYVDGDPGPLGDLAASDLTATFFGPQGGYRQGADEVRRTYAKDAGAFAPGGSTGFEILAMAAGDEVAYWSGLQHAKVRLAGRPEAVPMDLRVTEVFRREDGEWRLVHRHADRLASEQ